MKKTFIILFSILFIFTLCACSSENEMSELEKQYYDYAQECIEKGDTQTAIECLEEGITNTGSDELKNLLYNIKKTETTSENDSLIVSENSSDISSIENQKTASSNTITSSNEKKELSYKEVRKKWCYEWLTAGANLDDGFFGVSCEAQGEDSLRFYISSVQSAPANREAAFETYIDIDNAGLKNNESLELVFEEDGWGNSGKISLVNKGGYMLCEIYDVESSDEAWGLDEGKYKLYNNIQLLW